MRKWASTSVKSVLLTAGFVALGSGVAFADSDVASSGNGSVLGGNQAVVNADVPVNVAGNAVGAVLGTAGAGSTGSGAAVVHHDRHGPDVATSGNGSLLGGNQLVVDAEVPVNVAGNAVGAVGGVAGAAATDTDALVHEGHGHRHHHSAPAEYTAMDLVDEAVSNASVLPVPDTSGVDAGVLHQSAPREHQSAGHGHRSIATSGNGSLLGGNQAVVDLDVPVNVAGNAIGAVGGMAGAASTDTGALVLEEEEDIATSGNGSAAGGNQLVVDGDVPVNVTGNAIAAVAGVAGASSTDDGAAVVHQSATEHQAGVLDSAPLVNELPEVPVSEMLPVNYEVSESTRQAVEQHAPEQADKLPESAPLEVADPVGQVLGAAGVGL
ncbi:hypothetical protein A6A08_01530 [Nocardiopsis sp. TSRI0078]|uniref:hypothetical protein n=1 Tax=unclassified Nocardiopsis TaxID=2649073 RepID=UPI00093F24BA|nr:hypothetical protein [Nocardiopsis sp. TSRI0078]OKI23497.1 hypothetical protein A6A08_01530 [Nocardiopsis sp. TSRI0078]